MEADDLYYYEWDHKLKLSNPDFSQQLSTKHYNSSLGKLSAFPTDYFLAQFANLAYEDKSFSLPNGWELLTTATNNNTANGYFGVAFWNPTLCQVVVAHRGTQFTNLGSLITDLKLSLHKSRIGQACSAATFVHIIKNALSEKFYLSITGHSLGAWLAQISTFTCKYFTKKDYKLFEDQDYLNNIHPHTVVFESPGCREAFDKLQPRYDHRSYGNYNSLDMTVYLSKLNPINSVNEHVGIIFLVQSHTHSLKDIIRLFNKEDHSIEKEVLLDFQSGFLNSGKLFLKKLLPCSSLSKKVLKRPYYNNEYSLRVFNESELDFVKDWAFIKHSSTHLEEFQTNHAIPTFQIDYEYNVIISEEINKTIACIKYLRPTKQIIYDLLKKDVPDQVYYEILKMEAEHFQRYLLQLHDYYFRDVYDLKEFLMTNIPVLHIRIDESFANEYELEASILNNVIMFYQKNTELVIQNQYGYIKWHQLQQILKFLPDIFVKSKMNLFIIECFDATNVDSSSILEFLKRNEKLKVIIISTTKLSWKEDLPQIKEIPGFGNKVHFKDLIEESQNKFMKEHNLQICGRITNLKEIINLTFPFTEEVYEKLNQAIPVYALFELMLTPTNNPIIMDCACDNLLKPVIFIDLYQEVNILEMLFRSNDSKRFVNIIEDTGDPLLSNISASYQNVILESNIEKFETLCFTNYNKVVHLFTMTNGTFFLSKIFNKNLYMPRRIIITKKINPLFFSNLSDDSACFYFYGIESKFNNLNSFVREDLHYCLKFSNSKSEAKSKFEHTPSSMPAHLLKIVDDGIFLLKSQRNIIPLRKYLGTIGKIINETELSTKNGVRIITGEPGVGKSSLLASLYLKLQYTHWVFVIQLNQAHFTELTADKLNFDSAADFITRNSNAPNPDIAKYLLSYCLKNNTNLHVCLMFDGYDEINEKPNRRKLISLINFLQINTNTKFFITCRKYRCQELENGLSTFALQLESLSQETKMVNFFCEFWYTRLHLLQTNVDNAMQFQNFTFTMLENAKRFLGEDIYQLLGIPLHMRMMAEIITPQSSTTEITFADVLSLYRKYVDIHYSIYFKKQGMPDNQTITKWLSDSITRKHYNLAIVKIFDLDLSNVDYDDTEELNKVGLIQCDTYDYNNLKFLYELIRDYFVAHFFQNWLQNNFVIYTLEWNLETFIVSDFLTKPEYKEVRLFLNLMFINTTISDKKLAGCQDYVTKLWETNSGLFYNDNEESAFHVCVRENLYYLLKHFLLEIITKIDDKVKLLSKRNLNFETALFLADQYKNKNILQLLLEYIENFSVNDIKTIMLSTFFTMSSSEEGIDTAINYTQPFINATQVLKELKGHFPKIKVFFGLCETNNYTQLVQLLEELHHDKITKMYLMLISNNLKETGLHVTADKEIVNTLLKYGANINAQDHHGMTPLNRAIKRGNTVIAKRLIEKGALNISDLSGNTSILHAAKYNHLDILRLLVNKQESNIEQANIYNITPLMIASKNGNEAVINYLLEKGANINAVDCNGMTPLFYIVKCNQYNLIRIFRQRGADINVQDLFGITPLVFSISKRLWATVNVLLNNGADVNIGNSKRIFPLQLLIEMKQNNIIKKVLEEEVIATKGGGTLIREAADISILSDEQKAYIRTLLTGNIEI